MIKERRRPGPKPKPASDVRSVSVTMRTYPHVKAEMRRIGTAEVERLVMREAQRRQETGLTELRGAWVPAELVDRVRTLIAELVERKRAEKNAALIRNGYSGMWECTICGRIGSVGRCCGDETRKPADAEEAE